VPIEEAIGQDQKRGIQKNISEMFEGVWIPEQNLFHTGYSSPTLGYQQPGGAENR
jgi:hypothetical protein